MMTTMSKSLQLCRLLSGHVHQNPGMLLNIIKSSGLISSRCQNFLSSDSPPYLSDISHCSNYEFMQARYADLKKLIYEDCDQVYNLDSQGMYVLNQINLGFVKVYGFDYDYTLAQYNDVMQDFIYKTASEILVDKYKFPPDLKNMKYQNDFCIRGLHYDVDRSILMKVDACHVVQYGTVYRGLQRLEDEEVLRLFNGVRHIPKHIIDESYRGGDRLYQLMDIFSLPQMMLLTNVVEYFVQNDIVYDPNIVFSNVADAVRAVHVSGVLYNEVSTHLDKYLVKNHLRDLLSFLTSNGKKLFLITNSGYDFVDFGMQHMAGKDWRDAFEIILVDSKKPKFFFKGQRPFKQLTIDNNFAQVSWERVNELQKGVIYCQGSIAELMRLTGWTGGEVLYFGDQIYNDLSDVTFYYGWRTGAVIPELEAEIKAMNSEIFGQSVIWLQTLERLLERMQIYRDAESQSLIQEWLEERTQLKGVVKDIFNPRFGSIFRSNLAPSFFAARLCRIADIYTSSIDNLQRYFPDHFFFPARGSLPHEQVVALSYQFDGYDLAIEKALRDNRMQHVLKPRRK